MKKGQLHELKNCLRMDARCAILTIERESQRRTAYPTTDNFTSHEVSRQLFAVVGGYFFPLKIV